MTRATVKPRHVVCAIGGWKTFTALERVVTEVGGKGFTFDREQSQLEPDPRMAGAFVASADRVDPSLTEREFAAIRKHRAVGYILSPPMTAATGQDVSARMLAIVDALFAAGAVAIKGESSGIAHGSKRWRELAANAATGDRLERASALHLAWVRRPIGDDGMLYSCGMHLLGERDVELAASADERADIGWMDLLMIYLLAEKPARGVSDGEGFRKTPRGKRRVLRAIPCTRYESDDFFYNPYGYWRLD